MHSGTPNSSGALAIRRTARTAAIRLLPTLIWLSVLCLKGVPVRSVVKRLSKQAGNIRRCPDSHQATIRPPDWLVVRVEGNRQDDLTLAALAAVGAVSAYWLLQLCLWRGRQGSVDDHLQTQWEQAAEWQQVQVSWSLPYCWLSSINASQILDNHWLKVLVAQGSPLPSSIRPSNRPNWASVGGDRSLTSLGKTTAEKSSSSQLRTISNTARERVLPAPKTPASTGLIVQWGWPIIVPLWQWGRGHLHVRLRQGGCLEDTGHASLVRLLSPVSGNGAW